MKRVAVALAALVALGLMLVLLLLVRDEISWFSASHKGTKAPTSGAPVTAQPETQAVKDKRFHDELIAWTFAQRLDSVASYQTYASSYPNGAYIQQAEARISALRISQAPYEKATQTITEGSLRTFLADYPGHAREEDVRQLLEEMKDSRDIVDLLQEGKIEVQALGGGITKVVARLRRLTPQPVRVRIPIGTYFVSSNASTQNMVTTAERQVLLTSEDWMPVSVDAACANKPKKIPGGGDTFTVQRSPNQAELAQLMPALEKAKAKFSTSQAAVWIVTDNASYSALGVLMVSQSGIGGSRLINEKEAATAMRICSEAGIDITTKAIWRDHPRILSGVEASEVKTWLEEAVIADHSKGIEIDPRNVQAHVNRGIVYHDRGEHSRAIADYTKAIAIDPANKTAYYNRGFSHAASGEYDPAIQDYVRAIALDPRYVAAHHNRGVAYEAKSDIDRALADFRRAFAIDGNRFSADALKRLTPNP